MLALSSILAALYHREKTNEGQLVETSLLQSSLALQSPESVVALDAEKEGTLGACPYRLFETSDGGIFVGATQDKFWRGLCDAMERPDLSEDPKYATNPKRVEHMWELFEKLEPVFRIKTSAEWEKRLLDNDVPCGIVYGYEDFFLQNPQVQFMDMNPVIEHPMIGRMHVVGVPFEFEKTPGAIQRPAPLLGQHTEEILRDIGFDSARIAELLEKKVVRSAGV
jgi:crotonobetainyl-CoA:carnitine CoA-transferase CaiB-like acyl-CoA transferase